MILIALGANLPSNVGPPRTTLEHALRSLAQEGGEIVARSRFYRSSPVPKSDQPDYLNAVVAIKCDLDPPALLGRLAAIETRFGRQRGEPNRSEEHTSELQSRRDLVCRLLLEKKKKGKNDRIINRDRTHNHPT